jgi:hypothetical protein
MLNLRRRDSMKGLTHMRDKLCDSAIVSGMSAWPAASPVEPRRNEPARSER